MMGQSGTFSSCSVLLSGAMNLEMLMVPDLEWFDVMIFPLYGGAKVIHNRVLVAHTCKSSYLRGRDEEDHGSKSALVK
jgi:hypothetical protein